MIRILITFLILGAVLSAKAEAQDQFAEPRFGPEAREVAYEYSETYPGPKKRAKRKKYPSIASLRPLVKGFCLGLAQDARAEWLHQKLQDISKEEYRSCASCKVIFREIMKHCDPEVLSKPKRKKRTSRKKIESAREEGVTSEVPEEKAKKPTVPVVQLEPRLVVLDYASRFFRALAEDEENLKDTVIAAKRLEKILLDTTEQTAGQQSYYGILASFVYSSFHHYDREQLLKKRAEERLRQEAARELGLDEGFYYYDPEKEKAKLEELLRYP